MKQLGLMDKLSKTLSQVNWREWEMIVKKEPEWEHMKGFLPVYGFGPFAVTMLVTGLNDYQLRGKAEIAYWPKIRQLLETRPSPQSTEDLYHTLWPFYKEERLRTEKIKRLERFLCSKLAKKLWSINPREACKDFLKIWEELSRVMGQKQDAKTIVFAMKCLGIALLMSGEHEFDFKPIPIPVDSRVASLTYRLDAKVSSEDEIRDFWRNVLVRLNKENPRINMIHLDSLVWQVSPLKKMEDFQRFFERLGNPKTGESLCALVNR